MIFVSGQDSETPGAIAYTAIHPQPLMEGICDDGDNKQAASEAIVCLIIDLWLCTPVLCQVLQFCNAHFL